MFGWFNSIIIYFDSASYSICFLYLLTMFAGTVTSAILGGGGLGLHTLGIDILILIFKPFRIILYLNLSQAERDRIISSKEMSGKNLNLIDDIKASFAPGQISLIFGILAIIFAFISVL
ncbi:MAG: hypothetical protein N4J56_007980 [Chroococcidiopsis sp. SAG 2025]|uniref:hypothetical protein n=1 Tax=Chroococcidiopsis sp. SAG 2025 TaxID=171389 RepID=UPI0029370289|nr:hypothetical protein [Chroococcidiopsis sp. SAG 2025]MDV2998275.1 hypothetical protein [Chroococcidiopsis sp. SAG 2025]